MPIRSRTEKFRESLELTCFQVCFIIPALPKSSSFRKWLPKHRHILFGHFGYWILACLVTASFGSSLFSTCRKGEAYVQLAVLIVTSVLVSFPKILHGGWKQMFGPAILSFVMMMVTGLSLHRKPLICGIYRNTALGSQRARAAVWGITVALQIVTMCLSMLCYVFWHLKHKHEQHEIEEEAERAEAAGEGKGSPRNRRHSDEDSMADSPESVHVRWATNGADGLEDSEDEEEEEEDGGSSNRSHIV